MNAQAKDALRGLMPVQLDDLHSHPSNPRIALREDVIESISVQLIERGFHEKHAIHVRPIAEGFQIISGHHRVEAARRAGLGELPAWVEELDDERAYMELALSNAQGELSPLERGIHALGYVERSQGGRGKKGGLSEYARQTGSMRQYLAQLVEAAEVAKHASQLAGLEDKAQHLSALHSLPESCWPPAVYAMLSGEWSAKETGERVKEANEGTTDKRRLALLIRSTSHRELARIDDLRERIASSFEFDDVRELWLTWCAEEDPTDVKVVQAKRIELEEVEASRREAQGQPQVPSVVLADPPWRYDFAESDNRQIENQYPSASVEEICDHAPSTTADAVLFLWATAPKLREALEVMEAWGFEYKTHAIWDKEKIGMGYWFRGQHELLLVGTKGKASPPESELRVSSVFRESRATKHSRKPEAVYAWIERAFANDVKLEMYCRDPRTGWLVSGNEAVLRT